MMVEFPVPGFCGEPTADGDIAADFMRQWYEANRETWWQRHNWGIGGSAPDRAGVHADNFMLEWISQYHRLQSARKLI